MGEQKVEMSEELALKEIERWAEENDINLNVVGSDGKSRLDSTVPKLVRAVQQGRLVVTDEGDIEYTVSDRSPEGFAGEVLKIHAPNGSAYMGMDQFKDGQDVHKTLAMAAGITGKDVKWFARVDNRDYKIISILMSFFAAG